VSQHLLMRRRLLMLCHSLITSKRPLTNVASKHGNMRRRNTLGRRYTMRRCAAMLLHRFVAAEASLAFVTCMSAAESGVVGTRVVPQRDFGSEVLGANGTLMCHGDEAKAEGKGRN